MSLHINVEGGTRAGSRILKQRDWWECRCVYTPGIRPQTVGFEATGRVYRRHPGPRYSCPDCGTRRPT